MAEAEPRWRDRVRAVFAELQERVLWSVGGVAPRVARNDRAVASWWAFVATCVWATCVWAAAGVATAQVGARTDAPAEPVLEPTAEETEVLCWINRFRRDPQAFAQLVVDGNRPENAAEVDWQMFAAEIAELQPAPPLFFAPRLLRACRGHARYMVEAKEYGHHETEGRPGFLGEWPQDRARAVGYVGDVAESSGARGRSALEIVASNVVDAGVPGTGSGGMQERRGHRRCMIDCRWREVGVGIFGWGRGELSHVMLYGEAAASGRLLGGVAIEDRDGDGFYDVGEGLGGVHVSVGDLATMTSASGAWRIDLPTGAKRAPLIARLGPLERRLDVAAGRDDVLVDLLFDVGAAVRERDDELAALPETATARLRALRLELLQLRAPGDDVEVALAEQVAETKAGLLAALGTGSRSEFGKLVRAAKKEFARTVVESWAAQAQKVDELARAAAEARATTRDAQRTRRIAKVLDEIERELVAITSPDLWRVVAGLQHDLGGAGR